MKRVQIRSMHCGGYNKSRVFDYILDENGEELLEIKNGKQTVMVSLSDVTKQIEEARKR